MSPKARLHALSPRRRRFILAAALLAVAGAGGALVAQMEAATAASCRSTARGTLEITGIHVDVGAQGRRYRALCRLARRPARRLPAPWAKTNIARSSEAPNLSRFDARRSGQLDHRRERADRAQPLHRRSWACCSTGPGPGNCSVWRAHIRRSAPMLLIPVHGVGRHGNLGRTAQPLAARLGAVPHVAERDRYVRRQRDGRRSAAGQRRPGRPPGARLVAQHARSLRRGERAGRRSRAAPRFIRAARRGRDSSPASAPTASARRVRADRQGQRRHPAR